MTCVCCHSPEALPCGSKPMLWKPRPNCCGLRGLGSWVSVSPTPLPRPGYWRGRVCHGAAAMPRMDAAGCSMIDSARRPGPPNIALRRMCTCCQSMYVHTRRYKTSGDLCVTGQSLILQACGSNLTQSVPGLSTRRSHHQCLIIGS